MSPRGQKANQGFRNCYFMPRLWGSRRGFVNLQHKKIAGPTHKKPSFPYPSKACNFTFNSAASLRAHASAGVKFARVPRQIVRHSNTVDPRA